MQEINEYCDLFPEVKTLGIEDILTFYDSVDISYDWVIEMLVAYRYNCEMPNIIYTTFDKYIDNLSEQDKCRIICDYESFYGRHFK